MPSPFTHIIFRDGPNVFVQNTETGDIFPNIEGPNPDDPIPVAQTAQLLNQTFEENASILVKFAHYTIAEPVDIPNRMALTFEPGAELRVPNGYEQYVLGIGRGMERIQIRGGIIREEGSFFPDPPPRPRRQWVGVRLLQDAAGGIRYNIIDGLEIFHANVAILLRISHEGGWINTNTIQNITMWNANRFIDFRMPNIQSTGDNGFNRNLFSNIVGQVRSSVTEFGVRHIRHRANVFFNVMLIDFDPDDNPSAQTATIHRDAEDTLIIGGTMTIQNFEDQGQRTQILAPVDPAHLNQNQLILNRLEMRDPQGRDVISVRGGVGPSPALMIVGTQGRDGRIAVRNDQGDNCIILRGQTGDIITSNCDTAEDFEVEDISEAEPGTVMVINDDSQLCASSQAYDRRVAGVLSGAEEMRPGIILGRSENSHNRMPLALNGRVYCKADAQYGQIDVGDLLTTSPTLGHAMKVTDPTRAFGAVIGKALRPLLNGRGLIPILVSLQ